MSYFINTDKLQNLLRHFYTLTKIRIAVFDDGFRELASFPDHHSTYCRLLRQYPAMLEKCALCDREACKKSKKSGTRVIYRCHAGLVEAVTPIQYDNIVIGYIMLGQVLQTADYDTSWAELERYFADYGIDTAELKTAYYKKSSLSSEIIAAASEIMEACSVYLYLSKMITMREDSIAKRLDRYIAAHLSDELSAQTLCDALGISKTRLYETAEHSYGQGIAAHIRRLRIDKSRQLLASGDRKVSDIALDCGFEDYNYFTKVFKKTVGITPREYRKRVSEDK
jgi:AraC-like DNA-binding protein